MYYFVFWNGLLFEDLIYLIDTIIIYNSFYKLELCSLSYLMSVVGQL